MIRFITFEQIHNRKNIGSTKIRVHNLLKYWPEAGLYKYGENPDVLIFQKAYVTQDYKFPAHFKGIKILDICDPDWLDGVLLRQTIDAMDAITCPTQPIADFISQMTDKPVRVIKDRFDMYEFPKPKVHTGKVSKVCWFGYAHNAESLRFAIPSLAKRKLLLTIISDKDPEAFRWAGAEDYREMYEFRSYKQHSAYQFIQESDLVVLPKAYRPQDKYKSENKTTISRLLGVPVVCDADELDALMEAEARNDYVKKYYNKTKQEFNVKKSVEEYKELINELK